MSNTTVTEMSYFELKTLLEQKKSSEIEKVKKELTAAEGIVDALRAQLVNLGEMVEPKLAPVRRGRKPNRFKGPAAKKTTGKRAPRGSVGSAIREFVVGKGKAGAKVSEIAAHLKTKPANVTSFFYAKNNRKSFKKVAPATFALNGK